MDVNGNIEFPVLGELHVAGLTRLQLQDMITDQLKSNGYLSNPNVMVRFLNFKVFVLGTESGKVLNITEERCTFLEALAMAGGLDLYTRRDRIGVMREVNGKMVIHYLDPRSTEIFNDEFFLLQQNDIIFTEGDLVEKLEPTTPVSMNFWGFTPDYFEHSERSFVNFLTHSINVPKSEFFIPIVVSELVESGQSTVEVLRTDSKWFGVTYSEDRPAVVEKFAELHRQGIYPEKMF